MTPVETMDEGAAQAVAHRRGEQIRCRSISTRTAKSSSRASPEPKGSYHTDRMMQVRHEHRRRRHARQRRSDELARAAGLRHGQAMRVEATGATHTCIFVPPPFAADALFEAHDAGIAFAVCITEGIPVHDMLQGRRHDRRACGSSARTAPGSSRRAKRSVGIMPGHVFKEGDVGLISRSGTLTYEVVDRLTRAGLGQSTCVGIGGDPIIGTTFVDCLRAFKNDPRDQRDRHLRRDRRLRRRRRGRLRSGAPAGKPIVAFIGGRNAPPGKSLGHAGAIISGNFGTPQSKIAAFQAANVPVADRPSEIPSLACRADGRPRLSRRSRPS